MAPDNVYRLVGLGGLEPPTSPLSGVRSNHLSYRPSDWVSSATQLVAQRHLDPHKGFAPQSGRSVARAHQSRMLASPALQDNQVTYVGARAISACILVKGGDPAAGSPTATLLRLHPSH
jgi:hypothetical protein